MQVDNQKFAFSCTTTGLSLAVSELVMPFVPCSFPDVTQYHRVTGEEQGFPERSSGGLAPEILFKEEEAAGGVNIMWYTQYHQLNVSANKCHPFWCPVFPHHSFAERIKPVLITLPSLR